jgi:hypothetical protein
MIIVGRPAFSKLIRESSLFLWSRWQPLSAGSLDKNRPFRLTKYSGISCPMDRFRGAVGSLSCLIPSQRVNSVDKKASL